MDKNMIEAIEAINTCSEAYIGNDTSLALVNIIAKPGSTTTITDKNKKNIFNILQARVSEELLRTYRNDIITIIDQYDIRISKAMMYEGHEKIPGIIQYFFAREAEIKNRYETQQEVITNKTGYELPEWEKLFVRNYIIALRKQLFEICNDFKIWTDKVKSSQTTTGKPKKNKKEDKKETTHDVIKNKEEDKKEATPNGKKNNGKIVKQPTKRQNDSQSSITFIKEGIVLRYAPKGRENIVSFLQEELQRPLLIIDNGIIKQNGVSVESRIFQILDIMTRNESLIQEEHISNLRDTFKQISLSPTSYSNVEFLNDSYKHAIQQLHEEIAKQAENEPGEEIDSGPTPYDQKFAEIKARFDKTGFKYRKR